MVAECVANCVLSTGKKKEGCKYFLLKTNHFSRYLWKKMMKIMKYAMWTTVMQVFRYYRFALSHLDINILLAPEFLHFFGAQFHEIHKAFPRLMNSDVNRNYQNWNKWLYYDNSDPKRPKDFVTIHSLSGRTINALLIPFDVEGTHVLKGIIPAAAP